MMWSDPLPAADGAPLRVAFQGDRGAYGEEAIVALWGGRAEPVPVRTFAHVVRAVARGEADAGVLPVENSLVGPVREGVAALEAGRAEAALAVVGETVVAVRHCLLAPPGATLGGIRRVDSHPVALAQCRLFLARQGVEVREAFDTAGAAREVATLGDPTRAAIAGRGAAERYGLAVLAEHIADRADNRTRFLAVAR